MDNQKFYVESFGHDERSTQFSYGGCCDTLTSSDHKQPIIIAYPVENHPADSRVTLTKEGIVQTLSARMGTGGGNVPLVLMSEVKKPNCYAIDSHPADSRIEIAGDISPTLTVKLAKACSDGPLILVEENRGDDE